MSAEKREDIKETEKIIVLWQKPLIEIIDEMIFIDDVLVWRKGIFVGRNDI